MIFDTPAFVGTWTRRSACLIQLLRLMHKGARSTGGHCPGGGYKAHMIQYLAARYCADTAVNTAEAQKSSIRHRLLPWGPDGR
jgi:hypothetical protein